MPKSLHEDLIEAAKADRATLNQFICCALAASVRWRLTGSEAGGATPGRQRPALHPVDAMWRDLLR
jgi:hypothetical protein